jgi:hypothetical protein
MYQQRFNQSLSVDPFALTESDYEIWRRSTIPREMVDRLGVFRVDDVTGKQYVGKALKFGDGNDFAGQIIPFFSPFTGLEVIRRLRRDKPTIVIRDDGTAKEVEKYTQHYFDRLHLFYPMLVEPERYLEWLKDPSIPIVSTEGEKKSACLLRIALERMVDGKPPFIPIGVEGVNGYLCTIGTAEQANGERQKQTGLQHDFLVIPLNDRKFTVLFDADIHTNQSVKRAAKDYAREMYQLGAKAHIAEIPLELGLKGCDDIAYALGDDAVLEIIAKARPYTLTQPKRETHEERSRRGAVLREAVRRAEAAEAGEAVAKQTLPKKTYKKLAALFAQGGRLKAENRDLLFTLHALGEGEAEFPFYYRDLYRLLYPSDGSEIKSGKLTSTASQRIRRRFEKLAKDEDLSGIQFLELTPGSRDEDGERLPSRVRLFSYDYIEEIENLAAVAAKPARSEQASFEQAIRLFVQHRTGQPIKRKLEKKRNVFVEIKDSWRRIEGNLHVNVRRMRAQDYHDEAICDDLIKAIPADLLPALQARLASLQSLENETEDMPENPSENDDFPASDWMSKLTPRQPLESVPCDPFFEQNVHFAEAEIPAHDEEAFTI